MRWFPRLSVALLGRAAANVLAVALIGLAAHSWPVREYVRALVAERASGIAGTPVSIGHLHYNLLTLVFEADDVVVEARHGVDAPRGFARSVLLDLSWPALANRRFELQRVLVSELDLRALPATRGIGFDVSRISLQLRGTGARGLAGHVRTGGPVSVHVGSKARALTGLDADIVVDGDTLGVNELRLSAPGLDVTMAGSVDDLFGEAPRTSMKGMWRARVPDMCTLLLSHATPCAVVRTGTLQGSLAVGGALAAPVVHIDARTTELFAGGPQSTPIVIDGKAIVSARAIEIPRLAVTAFGGTASLQGSVLIGKSARIVGATLAWQGIHLGALLETIGYPAHLATTMDGSAVLVGDLLEPSAITIDARGALDVSRGSGVPATGRVVARLDGLQWSIGLAELTLGTISIGGEASGRVTSHSVDAWRLSSLAGSMRLETSGLRQALATARDLRVASVPRIETGEWEARAAAALQLNGTIARPEMGGLLEVTASRPRDSHPLSVYADVRIDDAGIQVESVHADRAGDQLKGSGRYTWRAAAIDGEFTAELADLVVFDDLLGGQRWQLTGRADAAGQITGTVSRPQVHGVVHVDDAVLSGPLLPGVGTNAGAEAPALRPTLRLGDVAVNVVAADRIEVRVDAPDRGVTASAVLAREAGWPFEIVMTLADVSVEDLLGASAGVPGLTGHMDGAVSVRGELSRPADVQADLQLTRLGAAAFGIRAALARPARVRVASGHVAEVLLDLRIDDLAVQLTRAQPDDPLHLAIEGVVPRVLSGLPETIAIVLAAVVDEERVTVSRASASLGEARADATAEIPLSFLDRWLPPILKLTCVDCGGRLQPALGRLKAAPTIVNTSELRSNSLDILRPQGEQRGSPAAAHVEVRSLPVEHIARAFSPGTAADIDGAFDLVVAMVADHPSLDAIRVDGRIERGRLQRAGIRLDQKGMATLTVRDGVASLEGWRWTAPGMDVTIGGHSTLDRRAPRFDAAVAGDVDLGAALPLRGGRVAGTARIDVSASGSPGAMSWNGRVELRDGAWVMRQQGVALTDVGTRVACVVDRCRVEQFSGRLNSGALVIEGDVPMPGTGSTGRLHATLRDAGLELPKGVRHDIDADLGLIGGESPRLTGSVTVWPAAVSGSIATLATLVSSPQAGAEIDERRDALAAALSQVAVDVRIASGDDLTFDSSDLQVTATADLRVGGTLARPRLRGQIATRDRGRIFLAGRTWDLEEGTLSLLEGQGGTDARVAATVTAPISKYVVRIRLSGPASRPTLVMSSDPPLGQSDLAELVLTGTTGGTLTKSGGQQVATLVSAELLTSVGRTIGVDAVRIEHAQSDLSAVDIEPVSRLTVSKRLTDKVEIVYSQGLSDSDDLAWILVLRPGWQSLDLRATVRTNGAEAYEVRQELEFGKPRPRGAVARFSRPTPPPVMRIDVAGVPPDQVAAVRDILALRVGDPFNTREWQRDREAVIRYFHERDRLRARVRASHAGGSGGAYVLTYDITPGPITRLEVRGYDIGRGTISALRDAWAEALVEDVVSDELSELVRIDLAARGYFRAEVTTTVGPLPDEGRLAIIDVVPGERTRRRSIAIAGNTAVATDDLRRTITERSLEPRCWIEPSLLEDPIAALYHERGYLAARVEAARVIANDRATLTVQVDEGRPFAVGVLTIDGTASLGASAARGGFGLSPGAPFSNQALSGALASLRTTYLRAGYLAAEMESREIVRKDLGTVDIAVSVKEGRASVLREIRVAGRQETSAKLVARALGIEAGGTVDPVALDEGQQRLYDTGIFRTVDIAVRPQDDATDAAEAVVTLEERARYRLRYGIQFGPSTIESITTQSNSAEPGATVDLQRRNLFGQGIVLGGGGVWSADQHRLRATVSAATFLGHVVSTTLTAEHANQDRVSDDSGLQIVDRSARAVLEQRWRFGRDRRVEIAYGFDVDHRRVELQATTADRLPLRGRFAGLTTTFTYDTRDNRLNPRRGMFHSSRIESGAGLWLSDVAFGRYQLQHFAYFPAGRLTLASGLRFGSLDVDDENEPASLLLYFKTGGGSSVRGYETDSLTPAYALGMPVGGKVLLVINEEVRVPLTRRFGVVGFFDAGNTFTGFDTVTLHGVKIGAGAGVRLDTPVAVLRFDVGMPLPRPPGGPRARWYLSVGQAF